MRILFLTSNLKIIGGIQRYNTNMIRFLHSNKNIKLKIIELKRSTCLSKIILIFKFSVYFFVFKPKIIFCTHINFSPLCLLFKQVFGINYIIFTHGIEVWNIKNKLKLKALISALKIVTVSIFTKEKIKEQINLSDDKFFILPNSVDDQKFFPEEKPEYLLKRHRLSKEDKIIFTLCRISSLEKYKGYDQVIESLPEIVNQIPNIKYIL